MLSLSLIRQSPTEVVAGLQKRHFAAAQSLVDQALALDQQRRDTQGQLDQTLAQSNQMARQIGQLLKAGQQAEAEAAKQQTATLKETARALGQQLSELEQALDEVLVQLPNLPHASVPPGRSAEDNEHIHQEGHIPTLPPDAKPHWELITHYRTPRGPLIDFEAGVRLTGAGFPVYRGPAARLQRALIQFFLDSAVAAGYEEVQPPLLINRDSGYGTGQLPDKDGQMYHATTDDLFLIPTAEVPITNLYRDLILDAADLPVRHVGYTPCFRREAGSWGAHVRGLNRLHQFDKVEIVQIRTPETSYAALEEMLAYVQGLLRQLELPYRVLRLCGGDMGFTSALTYDLEVFSAAQQRWLEVSSVSNFETFQANRLKLRYRTEEKKTALLHTLNGSALALPRIVAALLENGQTPEGIRLPAVLHPYTGFEVLK